VCGVYAGMRGWKGNVDYMARRWGAIQLVMMLCEQRRCYANACYAAVAAIVSAHMREARGALHKGAARLPLRSSRPSAFVGSPPTTSRGHGRR